MKNYTIDDIVSSVHKLHASKNGSKAAYKAHTTRRIQAYIVQRCSATGSKPSRVLAAIKAVISKNGLTLP